jgi:serine/threonine-protein kinase HipA
MAQASNRRAYQVFLDAKELGGTCLVGTLWRHTNRGDAPLSFEYDSRWLNHANAFVLDPRLVLYRGEQHPAHPAQAFGVFMDSSPDRWGRVLMERREAMNARRDSRPVRRLQEIDFLLGVHDLTRMGAIRLRESDDAPFLDNSLLGVPPVTDLPALARASRALEQDNAEEQPEYEQWLSLLMAPGTSLGGARPKANFAQADGSLWIAKFPSPMDRYDVGAWELLVQRLAQQAGIWVPPAQGLRLTERHTTYCSQRFDRQGPTGTERRMFSSAMTLLEATDGVTQASYLDLAQFISDAGAQGAIDQDLEQLFRRVLFNICIGNRDDHLRNHGFIRETTGWRLAPAFDVNPNPHRDHHTLTIDGNSSHPDLEAAMATADLYRLNKSKAKALRAEIEHAVRSWQKIAQSLGLPRSEIARMAQVIQAT